MKKHLRYWYRLFGKIKGKAVGIPIFYMVKSYRGYARNRVYNYALQNDVYLPRLIERDWRLDVSTMCYYPHNQVNKEFALKGKAYIKYVEVGYLEYLWARWLWKWCDDDSNFDTHDGKPSEETEESPFGTSWDLGDMRNDHPVEDKDKTWYWINRNAYYNANYMFEEMREDDPLFFYYKTKRIFPTFSYNKELPLLKRFTINLTEWHFGYIPYTNSGRQGRMVWFSEDIDKIDKEI